MTHQKNSKNFVQDSLGYKTLSVIIRRKKTTKKLYKTGLVCMQFLLLWNHKFTPCLILSNDLISHQWSKKSAQYLVT